MAPKNQPSPAKLRKIAEQRIGKRATSAASKRDSAASRLIHELEVHQVELEVQNEELRQTRTRLEIQNEELRQARQKLDAAYDELYDFAPVGYFTLGRHGEIEKTNLTGASMLGQPRAGLRGRRFAGFVTPESLSTFNGFLQKVTAGFDKESCMVKVMKGSNTHLDLYIEAAGMGPESNFRAVVVDITEAEQAKLSLRDSEERLKMALAALSMGVWEYECDTGDIYWSQECTNVFGLNTLCPKFGTLAQCLHPRDAPRIRSVINQMLADGKEQGLECRIVRPNGLVARISAFGYGQYNEAGKLLRLVGIVREIPARKRAQRKPRVSKRQVKAAAR